MTMSTDQQTRPCRGRYSAYCCWQLPRTRITTLVRIVSIQDSNIANTTRADGVGRREFVNDRTTTMQVSRSARAIHFPSFSSFYSPFRSHVMI